MIVIKDYVQTEPFADTDSKTKIRASLICDDVSDLPAPGDIPLYTLQQGSTAHIIADSTDYMMQSSGAWIQQVPPAIANCYSKSEIDDMLDTVDGQIQDISGNLSDVTNVQRMLIDSAAGKNIFGTSATTSTVGEVTFTNAGGGVWTTSGATTTARRQKTLDFTVPAGTPSGQYILTGCPQGGISGSTIKYCLYIWDSTIGARVNPGNDTGDGLQFTWSPDPTHSYNITIDIRSGQNVDGLTWRPMICLFDYYNQSHDFVPFCPTLPQLYDIVKSYHP